MHYSSYFLDVFILVEISTNVDTFEKQFNKVTIHENFNQFINIIHNKS